MNMVVQRWCAAAGRRKNRRRHSRSGARRAAGGGDLPSRRMFHGTGSARGAGADAGDAGAGAGQWRLSPSIDDCGQTRRARAAPSHGVTFARARNDRRDADRQARRTARLTWPSPPTRIGSIAGAASRGMRTADAADLASRLPRVVAQRARSRAASCMACMAAARWRWRNLLQYRRSKAAIRSSYRLRRSARGDQLFVREREWKPRKLFRLVDCSARCVQILAGERL